MVCSRSKILIIAFLIEGTALAAALLSAYFFSMKLFPLTDNFMQDILAGTLGALFLLVLFILSMSQRAATVPLIGSLRKLMITEVRMVFSDLTFFHLLVISLLAGFAEELLFRGILQVKFGIIIASILFGIVHFVTPAYAFITMLVGLYIGMFFHIFRHLLVPIHLHFLYDLGALIYLKYFVKTEHDET